LGDYLSQCFGLFEELYNVLPVEVLAAPGGNLVLRARGSELLILTNHVAALRSRKEPRDFTTYFMGEALINRPARKLFEAWLRKDKGLWRRIYDTVQTQMTDADFAGEESPVVEKPAKSTTEKPASKVKATTEAPVEAAKPAKKAAAESEKPVKKAAKKAESEEKAAKAKPAAKKSEAKSAKSSKEKAAPKKDAPKKAATAKKPAAKAAAKSKPASKKK
jgi:hypothetical protein